MSCLCVTCTENWRFSKLTQIKRLPLTVRVRAVDQQDAAVDLTGHKLRLIAINSTAFLRANAISNGISTTAWIHSFGV